MNNDQTQLNSDQTQFNYTPEPPLNPKPRKPKDSNTKWIIVGCIIIAVLILAAAIIFFLSGRKSGHSYDEEDDAPKQESFIKTTGGEEEEVEIKASHNYPEHMFGQGTIGKGSVSLELHINPEGVISGVYWNVPYNLKFSVTGNVTPEGAFDMVLTQVKDGVQTPLKLTTEDGVNFTGKWGKHDKYVHLKMGAYRRPQVKAGEQLETWHVEGPSGTKQLDADAQICFNGEDVTMFYTEQGRTNAMRLEPCEDGFNIINYSGEPMGTIVYDLDGTAYMFDTLGQQFYMYQK
ncbi:MAG: hypothetical protein NC217_07615 [Muribaculaceae bacterium]|nr:hypothetical protein [Muribaculaceae bacterium]